MAEKLRGILEGLLRVIVGASQIAIDRNADSGVIDFKEPIDQATAEIKSLYKSKLPKKKEITYMGDEPSCCYKSYNQALTEIEKIVEEL